MRSLFGVYALLTRTDNAIYVKCELSVRLTARMRKVKIVRFELEGECEGSRKLSEFKDRVHITLCVCCFFVAFASS